MQKISEGSISLRDGDARRLDGPTEVGSGLAHFFVRAFSSEGIDEFLGHVIAIEAALGMVRDHDRRSRPKAGGKDVSATERGARRIATLTGATTKADDFNRIFKLRSDFVHGKHVGLISPSERTMARSLAREVVNKLVEAAVTEPGVGREQYLEQAAASERGISAG